MPNKSELKTQITEATRQLEGLTKLQLLQSRYSVRFRFLDPGTGFNYYEVEKLGTNHKYTVKVKFIKYFNIFAVRSSFSFCPCARFSGEKNCHHLLLAIYFEAEKSNYAEQFDLGKFTDFRLAKVYRKSFEMEMAA